MKPLDIISLFVVALALFLLFFGLSEPMLDFKVIGHVKSDFFNVDRALIEKSQSILVTVKDLYSRNILFAATLILLFSVIIPFLKNILTLIYIFKKTPILKTIIKYLSKWSMADVFVVALFIVYLSTGGQGEYTRENINVMGFKLQLDVNIQLFTQLLSGFYYFAIYCLLSIVSGIIVSLED